MIKRMIICSMIVCLSLPFVAAQEQKITFCSVNASDSPVYRISNAVLTEAFKRLKIQFELRTYPTKRAPLAVNSGRLDGDAHRIYSFNNDHRYPNLIRVEESVLTVAQSVFTKLDHLQINGWESLKPFRVLYTAGIKIIEKGLNKAAIPPANRMPVDIVDNAFRMLAKDRGDVLINSPSTGQITLEKLGLQESGIKMLHPPLVEVKLYSYMHKKHATLANKLSHVLMKMKNDGTYQEILSRIGD